MIDSCRSISQELHEYVYRELDEVSVRRIDKHLAGCPSCRDDLHSLQTTLRLIDDATLEVEECLDEHFSSIVMSLIQRREADRVQPWAVPAVAACLLLALSLFQWRDLPRPVVPPQAPSPLVVQLNELAETDPLFAELAQQHTFFGQRTGAHPSQARTFL